MERREFLRWMGGAGLAALATPGWTPVPWRGEGGGYLLAPMDEAQGNHLKAYGLTYHVLQSGTRAEWLLNYRAGAFLLPDLPEVRREAALSGVTLEPVDGPGLADIRATIEQGNMDSIPLEKAPKVGVYKPPDSSPWDDAVTLALDYAGIAYDKLWDPEVLGGHLGEYEWLHLHHEDFTGQYSKFYLSFAGAPWLQEEVRRNRKVASDFGYPTVPALKKAVARRIRGFVEQGGFLFAMCTATETLDLALAAEHTDIAASFADGTPMAPDAQSAMEWDLAMAFHDAELVTDPSVAAFSDIDGHQVNTPWRQPLGTFTLFDFSAKIDPVATMLTQSHERVLPDFYGLTTSFTRKRLEPAMVVLADERGAPWVKYIHGERGDGTFTYLGGHDPEDPQHLIGDPPTDLGLHRHSPGYRLILNNVLFPAAKKKPLKT